MKLIKDGVVYETPIYTEVDGKQVELTIPQLFELGYKSYDNEVREIEYELQDQSFDTSDKLSVLLETITVKVPEGIEDEEGVIVLPFKLGYKWKPVYDKNTGVITYETVQVPNALGLETNPIMFFDGVTLIPNAFYTYNAMLYVYVGVKGTAGNWESVKDDMEAWNVNTESVSGDDKVVVNDAEHPIIFAEGVTLFPNFYYKNGDKVYVYMGTQKTATDFGSVADDMVEW